MRKYILFGKRANSLGWWENFMGGHITIGKTTIYGANAMCWTINIHTKKYGYICLRLPSLRGKKYNMSPYFYLSPNGTPWACTYYIGCDKKEHIRAHIRKLYFGHNFICEGENYNTLLKINDKYSTFNVYI